jgi:hypothetical protein
LLESLLFFFIFLFLNLLFFFLLAVPTPPAMSRKRTHAAAVDQDVRRREHNWPAAYRKLCVALIEQHRATDGQDGISIASLCRTPGAPARSTLNSWLSGEMKGVQESMPASAFDRRSKLSVEEELVVVGYLLHVLQAHRVVVFGHCHRVRPYFLGHQGGG